jgi:hypothetical protein
MPHLKLSKKCSWDNFFEKQTKSATHMDLWKYGQILTTQMSLIIKWLRFSKKRFFIWVNHLILHYILSPNNKFGMWINIFFSFCDVLVKWPIHILTSKVHYYQQTSFLSINNHKILFIMKLLVYIQVLISKSKDILITTSIWINGT